MSARGFSLLELLVATALLLCVTAAIAAVAVPAHDAVARTLARDDAIAGARSAMDALVAAVREAGAVPALGGDALFATTIEPVRVTRDFDDDEPVTTGGVVRLLTIPRHAAQGRIGQHAGAGAAELIVAAPCRMDRPVCGFAPGDAAVVIDGAGIIFVGVRGIQPPARLLIAPALPAPVGAGAVVAAISVVQFGTRTRANGQVDLVRIDDGTLQPMLDHVSAFEVTRLPQTLRVRLRVAAAADRVRGPTGTPLVMARTTRLPDVDLTMTIALRNVPP